MPTVNIIGGGLAGSECAYQLAKQGIDVQLYEMRPEVQTPVHKTPYLAELVCSNSLKSTSIDNASGVLKEEMRILNSLILRVADDTRVPAGTALAVDRERFASRITEMIEKEEHIHLIRREITSIDDGIWVIATGPLTSSSLSKKIKQMTGEEHLYFFDAISPIIYTESIDMNRVVKANRYQEDGGDYLNCFMNEEEYTWFWQELINAECLPMKAFEKGLLFERCKPIEDIAKTGKDAMRFGPLRPTGLVDSGTNKMPYAAVQLRAENKERTMYNMVGFQTRLKWGEQKRVFRFIPGLRNASFVRYGVMHRNTFINSPECLDIFLRLKGNPNVWFAGQITGVEGYVESAAMGLYVALNLIKTIKGEEPQSLSDDTMMGSLVRYITTPNVSFQPIYANFGILPTLPVKNKWKRRHLLAVRAIESIKAWKEKIFLKK